MDSTDHKKHMGLKLIPPCWERERVNLIFDKDYVEGYTDCNSTLLYQGLTMSSRNFIKLRFFVYVAITIPSESSNIARRFKDFDCIIGEMNLNLALAEQTNKNF